MAEKPLVEADIRAGHELLALLDRIEMPVRGAFWLYRGDTERWRLVIVTEEAKSGSTDLYLKLINAGAKMDLALVEFQTPASPYFKALGGMGPVEGDAEVRMSQFVSNGVYFEDAVIYRLAA